MSDMAQMVSAIVFGTPVFWWIFNQRSEYGAPKGVGQAAAIGFIGLVVVAAIVYQGCN